MGKFSRNNLLLPTDVELCASDKFTVLPIDSSLSVFRRVTYRYDSVKIYKNYRFPTLIHSVINRKDLVKNFSISINRN